MYSTKWHCDTGTPRQRLDQAHRYGRKSWALNQSRLLRDYIIARSWDEPDYDSHEAEKLGYT